MIVSIDKHAMFLHPFYHNSIFLFVPEICKLSQEVFSLRLKKGRGFFCEIWEDLEETFNDWILPPTPPRGLFRKSSWGC